jgi:hypothetical protein
MRWSLIAFLACLTGASAAAQCPIQPRQALFDPALKSVTVRYYNSGDHVVRDVQFILISEDGIRGQSAVGAFSARNAVPPKQERTVVFPNISGKMFNGTMELEVARVSFSDHSPWIAVRPNVCTVQFTEP